MRNQSYHEYDTNNTDLKIETISAGCSLPDTNFLKLILGLISNLLLISPPQSFATLAELSKLFWVVDMTHFLFGPTLYIEQPYNPFFLLVIWNLLKMIRNMIFSIQEINDSNVIFRDLLRIIYKTTDIDIVCLSKWTLLYG